VIILSRSLEERSCGKGLYPQTFEAPPACLILMDRTQLSNQCMLPNNVDYNLLITPTDNPDKNGLGWNIAGDGVDDGKAPKIVAPPPNLVDYFGTMGLPKTSVYTQVQAVGPTVTVGAKKTKVSGSVYKNVYGLNQGVIVASDIKSNGYDLHWAPVTAVIWQNMAATGKKRSSPILKYIFQNTIANAITKGILDKTGQGTFDPVKDKEKFLAILGSPNGRGSPFLLGQNIAIFGAKTIQNIIVWKPKGLANYMMRLNVVDWTAPPPKEKSSCAVMKRDVDDME